MFACKIVSLGIKSSAGQLKCLCTISRCLLSSFDDLTSQQRLKVLGTLNEATAQELEAFDVPKTIIRDIIDERKTNGVYRSLDRILKIDGSGENWLRKMCKSLTDVATKPSRTKNAKNFLTPTLPNIELRDAVAIHLKTPGVSWAKLSYPDNTLTEWNHENFTFLPLKMSPVETFNQTIGILKKIPPADVYVFEQRLSPGPRGSRQPAMVSAYTQQGELLSMLVALLNTSINHNASLRNGKMDSKNNIENRVFFLKSTLAPRLFRTLIGGERVSALEVLKEFLEGDGSKHPQIPCTQIKVNARLKTEFNSKSAVDKELLGQALMLAVAFMEFCVYKNRASIEALASSR
ncbi:uncharacterized protein LOC132697955 [Cylas formicarius]|uniref:uncharacterized protein LOC132697955 n=1 Tax=Cylas formicarius TaxID=197179 RepID=UPI002958610C|nr:uncharacterized protein LOC132697955 [Cylas formicarius]